MPAATKKETAAEKRTVERSRVKGVNAAIAAVMADMPHIERRQVQTFTAFNVDDVYATLRTLFIKHGLIIVPTSMEAAYTEGVYKSGTAYVDARIRATWSLIAVDDGSMLPLVFCAEGRDSQDKATNKAVQQALKYALIQMFLINTGEDAEEDPGEGDEPAGAESFEVDAKQHVFAAANNDRDEASKLWPLVLEAADVTEVTTAEERDTVVYALNEMFKP